MEDVGSTPIMGSKQGYEMKNLKDFIVEGKQPFANEVAQKIIELTKTFINDINSKAEKAGYRIAPSSSSDNFRIALKKDGKNLEYNGLNSGKYREHLMVTAYSIPDGIFGVKHGAAFSGKDGAKVNFGVLHVSDDSVKEYKKFLESAKKELNKYIGL